MKLVRATMRTGYGDRLPVVTVVAHERPSLPVHREADRAIRTRHPLAAYSAQKRGCETAAIQQQQGLFATLQALGDRILELLRQQGSSRYLEALAHIHDTHFGQRTRCHALRQLEISVVARACLVKGLDRRSG